MASPLCVTLAVIIIIIISSEVKTTIGINDVDNAVEPDVVPNKTAVISPYASKCTVQYTLTYGYKYYHYWANSIQFTRNTKSETLNGATLHFRVRANSDAHILLSNIENPTISSGEVYEIVIGAGRNSFSDIRRAQRTSTKATMSTPNFLSGLEPRGFWIRMSNDGTIAVGKEGDEIPFMAWKDPLPFQIKYFSFCTWNGVFGKWEYNCPDFPTNSAKESEPEEKLSTRQKLAKTLFDKYDPYLVPTLNLKKAKSVTMDFTSTSITISEAESSITACGVLIMVWHDEILTWKPEEYEDLKSLRLSVDKVWKPNLMLYNAADGKGTNLFGTSDLVMLHFDGLLNWNPTVCLEALCSLDLHLWPFDRHTCTFTVGSWAQEGLINISTTHEPKVALHASGTWAVESLEERFDILAELHPHAEDMYYEEDEDADEEFYESNYAITFAATVRRHSNVYVWALYAPVVVLTIFVFLTYWMDASNYRLVSCIINLTIILGIMMSFFLAFPGSTNKTPHIIAFYSDCLILATLSTLTCVLVMNINSKKFKGPPPAWVVNCLSYIPLVGTANLTSSIRHVVSGRRNIFIGNRQMDHQAFGDDMDEPLDEEECNKQTQSVQEQWSMVADAIDLIAFLSTSIYAGFFIIF